MELFFGAIDGPDGYEGGYWPATATSDGISVTAVSDTTVTFAVHEAPAGYSVALKSGTADATSWQGKAGTGDYQSLPLTGLEAGTAVTVKYSGAKKVKSVKAVKKVTLADALVYGATVTIAYDYGNDESTNTFTCNGDGTYTLAIGTGEAGAALSYTHSMNVVNGKIIFKCYPNGDNEDGSTSFKVTFDPSTNTYTQWAGVQAEMANPTFTSISVNGTDITSQLTKQE